MAKREMCVFTIVQNDPWMAFRWYNYYRNYFYGQDMYIHDHLLDDKGCTGNLRDLCNTIPLAHDLSFDHDWLTATVCKIQTELLQEYDKVLFAEIDEFVAPDPDKYDGLTDYIRKFDGDYVRTMGMNVIAVNEPPLDRDAFSILGQRSYWVHHFLFDKPILTTRPLEYEVGFHHVPNTEPVIDPDLKLIHLKWVCIDYLIAKNHEICERKWHEYDWGSDRGFEHKMLERTEIENYIKTMGEPEPIPERFKHLL